MKKAVFIFALLLYSITSLAQQDPHFTHYMYNMSIVNPAYTTARTGNIDTGVFYRTQWVNVEGAPQTGTLFAHATLPAGVEVGINVINDRIGLDGEITETNANADVAYRFELARDFFLSLGVKAGITNYNADFSRLQLNSGGAPTDPLFAQNINSNFLTFGAGAFLYTKEFYLGISSPNFIPTKHIEDTASYEARSFEELHAYLTVGYIFNINKDFKLKPSALVKHVANAPISADVSLNLLVQEKFEIGASYRLEDAVALMLRYDITPNFKIGYAYDYTLSGLNEFSRGSHEVFLMYSFQLRKYIDCYSNRFF
ncbi:PorP/SprF family type IX secretion system membrane protein [Aquimarina rhabdastrellae]